MTIVTVGLFEALSGYYEGIENNGPITCLLGAGVRNTSSHALYDSSLKQLFDPCELGTIFIPIFQLWKLRPREVEKFA